MAKVVFGGLVSEVRGTLGADVYTRNKSGGIVRTQTLNPWVNTTLRAFAVDVIVEILRWWSEELDEDMRHAWNAFAVVQSRSHTAIAQTQLSGQMWFLKLNVPLYHNEQPLREYPPPDLSVTAMTELSIDHIAIAATEFIVNWQPPQPGDHVLRILATDSLSPGVSSWLHQLGYASSQWIPDAITANIWEAYLDYHPTPVLGNKIGITARFLNCNNGVYSRPLRADAIVGA
jgi:hypothetical protein